MANSHPSPPRFDACSRMPVNQKLTACSRCSAVSINHCPATIAWRGDDYCGEARPVKVAPEGQVRQRPDAVNATFMSKENVLTRCKKMPWWTKKHSVDRRRRIQDTTNEHNASISGQTSLSGIIPEGDSDMPPYDNNNNIMNVLNVLNNQLAFSIKPNPKLMS